MAKYYRKLLLRLEKKTIGGGNYRFQIAQMASGCRLDGLVGNGDDYYH